MLDVMMNFISLTIIVELDDYFFKTLNENPISELIIDGETTICNQTVRLAEMIKIETTTSKEARLRIDGNKLGG